MKIAAAYRHARSQAKYWKSVIWGVALLLTIVHVSTAVNHQYLKSYLPEDLAAMVVSISYLLMLANTLGKHYLINRFTGLSSILLRLYDFEVLGIGSKPTMLEITSFQVEKFSKLWLDKNPTDHPDLYEWWPGSVSNLTENAGISFRLLYTIKWENELRKKHRLVLIFVGLIAILVSLLLKHHLDYGTSEYIIKLLVPLSPLISILVLELLLNNSCSIVAKNASLDAQKLWDKHCSASDDQFVTKNELNQLASLWGNYRSIASPIFNWLYWITRAIMNMDMVVDANELVKGRKK